MCGAARLVHAYLCESNNSLRGTTPSSSCPLFTLFFQSLRLPSSSWDSANTKCPHRAHKHESQVTSFIRTRRIAPLFRERLVSHFASKCEARLESHRLHRQRHRQNPSSEVFPQATEVPRLGTLADRHTPLTLFSSLLVPQKRVLTINLIAFLLLNRIQWNDGEFYTQISRTPWREIWVTKFRVQPPQDTRNASTSQLPRIFATWLLLLASVVVQVQVVLAVNKTWIFHAVVRV